MFIKKERNGCFMLITKLEKDPFKVLRKLRIIVIILILLGIIFYFLNWQVGVALFVGGILTLITTILLYLKVRKKNERIDLKKFFGIIYVIIGFLLLGIGLALLLLGKYKLEAIVNIISGVFFLIAGSWRFKINK